MIININNFIILINIKDKNIVNCNCFPSKNIYVSKKFIPVVRKINIYYVVRSILLDDIGL